VSDGGWVVFKIACSYLYIRTTFVGFDHKSYFTKQ